MTEENYEDEYLTDEERAEKYNEKYVSAFHKKVSKRDADEQEAIIAEMEKITYRPSSNPENDAELNYLRASEALRKKEKKTIDSPVVRSYGKFMARSEGLSKAEVRKKLREYLK